MLCKLVIKNDEKSSQLIEELYAQGFCPVVIEEEGICTLFAEFQEIPTGWEMIESKVDWESQWQPYQEFSLKSGPGFGDASHPTTQMMLKLLKMQVKDKHVVDLGSGSGILSVAALYGGAKEVIAIDIDPLALDHTRENCHFHGFSDKMSYFLPADLPLIDFPYVLLMNMIFLEQKTAYSSLKSLPEVIITSGILEEQETVYLNWAEKKGWKLLHKEINSSWLSFLFES